MTTRHTTRGGVGAYVRTMSVTPLWSDWSIELESTHRDGGRVARAREFLRGLARLAVRIRRRRPVLVHLHMASYGSCARKLVVAALCRRHRIPVVVHVHGGEFGGFFDRLPGPARRGVRNLLERSDAVVALGDRWAARLREIAPGARVVVVPNAVALPPAAPARPRGGAVTVLFLGDVREAKGVFDLLAAWPQVVAATPDARLVIAGAGEVDRARALLRDAGTGGSVEIRGWIDPADVPSLLAETDVLTLPSHHEGQPMAVIEAMAHGICVVASQVGGIPDLVEDGRTGVLVPPRDPGRLTAALSAVTGDDAVRGHLGAAARAAAEQRFDVEIVRRRIDDLYHDILGAPAPQDDGKGRGPMDADRPGLPQLRSEDHDLEIFESHIRSRAVAGRAVRILEAGCGRRWGLALDGVGIHLTGVDSDREALRIRREVRKDMDVAIEGDLETVDLPEGGYDVVYNSFVLEHVREADRVLANFVSWLSPGGVLLLRFPDRRSVRGFVTRVTPHWMHVLYYRFVLRYPGAGRPGHPPYPVVYHPTVSLEGMRRFCREHGLVLREEWGDGQHLLWGSPRVERLTRAGMRAVAAATFGALTADHTNLIYVIEKPATTAGPAPTPPAEPVRLDVVLDEAELGGAEIQTLALFSALDPLVVRPRLVCLRAAGPLAADFRAAGFEVEVVERSGRYDPRRLGRLVAALRRNRTDVVLVTHFQRAGLLVGRLAARLLKIPHVIAVHDMDLARVGGRCLPRHVVETLAMTDALVLLAPSQARYLRDEERVGNRPWRRTREIVVPNGIRIPAVVTPGRRAATRARLGVGPDEVLVGVVARLTAQKAHEVLLRSVAVLAPRRPELRLVVVGDGPRAAELRALSAELGITDRVVFTGVRRDVADIMAALDVFALSSVHEGAPITVMEAMAAGTPVVVTGCGALPDMVDDGVEGLIAPVGDVAGLARRLEQLVDDPAGRVAMGKRARVRAEREFSVSRTVEGYTRLLLGLAGR